MTDAALHDALLSLTGLLNRPQSDTVLLRRAGSSLDRALFPLLVRAARRDGVPVGELADAVGRHYSTVSRQLVGLERQGFLRRVHDPDDRRHSLIHVTAGGRAEVARIAAARSQVMAGVFRDWTEADKHKLVRLITQLVAGLEAATTRANPGTERA